MSPKQWQEKRDYQQLKLSRFADEWMRNGGNGTKASMALFPHLSKARHRVNGAKLLRACRDGGLLDAMVNVAQRAMGVDELIQRTSEVARANILDYADVHPDGSFAFNLTKAAKAGGHLIKTLKHDAESGAPVIELYPADQARKQLGKWAGLGEKNAPAAGPAIQVIVNVLSSLPKDAQGALFRALMQAGQGMAGHGQPIETVTTEPDSDDTSDDEP